MTSDTSISFRNLTLDALHSAYQLYFEPIVWTAKRIRAWRRATAPADMNGESAPTELDLNVVVKQLEAMHRFIGEETELVTSLAADLGYVKADRLKIEQVILNLANNARDAMPKGGRVTIETARVELAEPYASRVLQLKPGTYVTLTVKSTGVDIDDQAWSGVFEPFFTTREGGISTGLGLAIASRIVNECGGYLRSEAQIGQGTGFRIFMPRVAAPAERYGKTILLVESEAEVRDLVRQVLRKTGYVVLEAKSGLEALKIATGQTPVDLLLTDVIMPGISGRELAERLSAEQPQAKVLYISSLADETDSRHDVRDTDFLYKPFSEKSLAEKVRKILAEETHH